MSRSDKRAAIAERNRQRTIDQTVLITRGPRVVGSLFPDDRVDFLSFRRFAIRFAIQIAVFSLASAAIAAIL